MAAKKVKKSNVRQDDPYDYANKSWRQSSNPHMDSWRDLYAKFDVHPGQPLPEVFAIDFKKKNTGGAAGRTITTPAFLRSDAEKRTKRQSKSVNGSRTKKR